MNTINTRPTQVKLGQPNQKRRGCSVGIALFLIPMCLWIAFLIWRPGRVNVLILGLDTREPGSNLGRSDTMILTTFLPAEPYVGLLSIPRDLWVIIPGWGENRINAAHFFAESEFPGSGPDHL